MKLSHLFLIALTAIAFYVSSYFIFTETQSYTVSGLQCVNRKIPYKELYYFWYPLTLCEVRFRKDKAYSATHDGSRLF